MTFEDSILKKLSKQKPTYRTTITQLRKTQPSYFYLKPNEKYNYAKHRLLTMKPYFLELLSIEDFLPTTHKSQKSFQIYGLISIQNCKNEEKVKYIINFIDDSNCVPVKLKLDKLKYYSFFNGQVLALTGYNLGEEFVVEQIHSIPVINLNSNIDNIEKFNEIYKEKELSMKIVSGPYGEAFESIFKDIVDVLIILGPIIDKPSENSIDDILLKYSNMMEAWLRRSMTSRIVLVPSTDDIFMMPIYPQDPYNFIRNERITLLPNPALFYINEILIGISTNDLLLNLGRNENSYVNKEMVVYNEDHSMMKLFENDALHRLSYHLVFQMSFLPVFPLEKDEPVNYSIFEKGYDENAVNALDVDVAPDIFITSSKFKEGSRIVEMTRVINLGKGTRKEFKNSFNLRIAPAKKIDDENFASITERTVIELNKYDE